MIIYTVSFAMILVLRTAQAAELSNDEDVKVLGNRPVLDVSQLVDLVLEAEQRWRPEGRQAEANPRLLIAPHLVLASADVTTTEDGGGEKLLKNRKVWSRWSKWSECSVTCGAGTAARVRTCVAGRCARGEREEQRRQCARPPCAGVDHSVQLQPASDQHYFD